MGDLKFTELEIKMILKLYNDVLSVWKLHKITGIPQGQLKKLLKLQNRRIYA